MLPIDTVIAQWKGLDWNRFVTRVDNEIIKQLSLEQQQILTDRKHLVDITKEFKMLSDEEKVLRIKDILKEYQILIDHLSTKFKNTENTCHEILNAVLVLANPLPFLVESSNSAANEAEMAMLREENELYRGQLENLSKTVKERDMTLEGLQEKYEAATQTIQSTNEENAMLKSDFESAKALVEKLYQEKELMSQNLEDSKSAFIEASKKLEIFIRTKDAAVENLQNENEILSASLEQSRLKIIEMASASNANVNGLYNYEMTLEQHKNQWEQERKRLEEHFQMLEAKNEEIEKNRLSLLETIETMGDYSAIKSELSLLKNEKFGAKEGNVEDLFSAKCKVLENEIVSLRLELERLTKSEHVCKQEISEYSEKMTTLESTIRQYESIIKSQMNQTSASMDASSILSGEDVVNSDAIITVLSNQRERFKKKNLELEEKFQRVNETLKIQKNEISLCKSENAKLFEKIKYLENYRGSKKDIELGDVYQKYSPIYEERLDPFNQFFQLEIVRKVKALGKTDRALWRVSRVFFTNRFWRKLTLLYLLLLHIAFIYMTYRLFNQQVSVK